MSNKEHKARRTQIILGLIMGTIMGVVLGWLTQFWLWLPAGIIFGFVTGVLMKPPAQK